MRYLVAILILPFLALAHASGQERQVSFDTTGTVWVLTANLNRQHQLLPDLPTLVEARLFVASDTAYYLDVILDEGGSRLRRRVDLTESAVLDLRRRSSMVLISFDVDDSAELDQSGRAALLWGSTIWSLLYYGTATSIALNIDEPAVPILLAGGLGYLVPALLTNNAPVTEGAASLALGGMFQGTIHGWALAALVAGEDLFDAETPRLGFGLSVLTGIGESIVGYAVATNSNMSEGRAGVINTTSFYGLVCGGLASAAIFDQVDPSSDVASRVVGGAALAGAAAGVIIGNAVADGQHYSSGDASMYGITGFFGATLPWVVLATVQPESPSATLVSTLSIATTVGGLWLGDQLVQGKDYRSNDGTISVLSLLGGGLIGLGVAELVDSDQAYAALTYAGAIGGFAISLAMAKPTVETKSMSALEVNVNPLGPIMLQRDAFGITRPAPFATLRYRF